VLPEPDCRRRGDGRRRLRDPVLGGDQRLCRGGLVRRAGELHHLRERPRGAVGDPRSPGGLAARQCRRDLRGDAALAAEAARRAARRGRSRVRDSRRPPRVAAAGGRVACSRPCRSSSRGRRGASAAFPRDAAPPDGGDRLDGGARVPRRRARLASLSCRASGCSRAHGEAR
jgi:hypothetical protein